MANWFQLISYGVAASINSGHGMMLDVSLFSRAKYSAIAISRNAFELTMQCLM